MKERQDYCLFGNQLRELLTRHQRDKTVLTDPKLFARDMENARQICIKMQRRTQICARCLFPELELTKVEEKH